jgi:hypothetical protein
MSTVGRGRRMLKLRLARILREAAAQLDAETRPLTVERDGKVLRLPPGSTLEQALDLLARVEEFLPPARGPRP